MVWSVWELMEASPRGSTSRPCLETREGQTKLALGGNQHDLGLNDEITPGRQATVEVSGAGLGNGDEADSLAVATVSRNVLKETRPGIMVNNRREGRLCLMRG